MPSFEDKLKKIPKNLCKALKSTVIIFSKRSSEKQQNKTAKSVYSRYYSQSVVSVKERFDKSHNFYFTKRTNHMLLTCQDNQDTVDLLKTRTFHGVFLASGEIHSNKIFILSNKDKNNSCCHQAVVHVSPMNGKMSRTKSIDSLETSPHSSLSCTKTISRKIKPNKIVKYSKFIPVYDALGDKYPRGPISDRSLLCWLDLQAWYVNYLEVKLDRTGFLENKGYDDMELYRPSLNQRNQQRKVHEHFAFVDNRFGKKNEEYLKTFTKDPEEDESLAIQMYVQMSNSSMNLCRIKSEMIVCCLQNFFKPFDSFDLMWVADLDGHMVEIQDNRTCDIFKRDVVDMVDMEKVKALLYLPQIPAAKLRHKDLCVLDTIAKTLDLSADQILYLPIERQRFLW